MFAVSTSVRRGTYPPRTHTVVWGSRFVKRPDREVCKDCRRRANLRPLRRGKSRPPVCGVSVPGPRRTEGRVSIDRPAGRRLNLNEGFARDINLPGWAEQSIWGYDPLLKCYWAALWRDEDHPRVRESHHAQAHLLPHPDIRAVTNHGRGRGSRARSTCGSPHSWGQRPHQGPVSHTTLRDATRSSRLLTQPMLGCSVGGKALTLAVRQGADTRFHCRAKEQRHEVRPPGSARKHRLGQAKV